eukprot:6030788-Pyramimonas_sp.AAC.1
MKGIFGLSPSLGNHCRRRAVVTTAFVHAWIRAHVMLPWMRMRGSRSRTRPGQLLTCEGCPRALQAHGFGSLD